MARLDIIKRGVKLRAEGDGKIINLILEEMPEKRMIRK